VLDIIPFEFEGAAVRVIDRAGEPWFVGKDVAERLGYADPTNAMKQHCRGVVKRHPIVDALDRTQEVRILSEPDVLRLIVGSRLPAAQRFERWVFEEVLPAIRKDGGHVMDKATNIIPFEFEGAAVRVIDRAGEPWFVAKDAATILGYANPQKSVRDHCKSQCPVGVNVSFTPGGPQEMAVINESGLYGLILTSLMRSRSAKTGPAFLPAPL